MRVKRFVGAGVISIALVVALAGCSSGGGETLGTSADLVAKDTPNYHYEPKTLKASNASEVSFTFKNDGKVEHNFTISFLGVDTDVQPGQSTTIKFSVKSPPKGLDYFTFYCKYHQGQGMQGRLVVT